MIDYVTPILDKYFKYDKIFDLLEYDSKMLDLYNELKTLCRDSYEYNYRFVFLHYDTDYYIKNDQPGITLRNLQRIMWKLKIGNYFCLILSQQDLKSELEQLRLEETTDNTAIACITHPLQDINYIPKLTNNINHCKVEKNYMSLTRHKRFHRTALFTLLQDKDLLDKGLVTFGSQSS